MRPGLLTIPGQAVDEDDACSFSFSEQATRNMVPQMALTLLLANHHKARCICANPTSDLTCFQHEM